MRFHRHAVMLASLGLAVFLLGCERYIDTTAPIGPVPTGPPSPVNVTAQLENQAVALSWQLPDSSRADKFRIYTADSTGAAYVRRDSSLVFSKLVTGLPVNQKIYFKVATVDQNGVEGTASIPISVRVGVLGMIIDNDQPFTRDREVTVSFTAPIGTTYLQISESPILTSVTPQLFTSVRTFTLSAGDGEKTVYAKYIVGDGTQSVALISDGIVLDSRAAIDSVYFTSTATAPYEAGDRIKFMLAASGETGGEATVSFTGGGAAIRLYDDGLYGDVTPNDGLYSTDWVVPVNVAVAGVKVTGSFMDAAGNRATNVTSGKTLTIEDLPEAVEFTILASNSTYLIDLNWYASTDDNFTAYKIYRANTASVTESSKLIATIASKGVDNWTDTALAANTTYYYRIYVVNSSGTTAGSTVRSAATLPNTIPSAVTLAVGLSDATQASLTWSATNEEDFLSYQIYRATAPGVDPSDQLIAVLNTRASTSLSNYLPNSGTTYYFRVYVVDRHGAQTGSNEVSISRP